MVDISENKRAIPTDQQQFQGNKKICDIMYMYLQYISQRNSEEQHRYVCRSNLSLKTISANLKISVSTVQRRLAELEGECLITKDDKYIVLSVPHRYFLLPQKTLEFMFDNGLHLEPNLFKILSWIGDRNKIFPNKVYLTQNLMLELLGENKKSTAAARKFKHNLQLLIKLGFFKIAIEKSNNGNLVMRAYDFQTEIKLDNTVENYYSRHKQ